MYQNISRHNHDISLQLSGLSSQQLRCWYFFPPWFLGDPGSAPYGTVKAARYTTTSGCQSLPIFWLQVSLTHHSSWVKVQFLSMFRHVSPFIPLEKSHFFLGELSAPAG
jgi:hypothetical protein